MSGRCFRPLLTGAFVLAVAGSIPLAADRQAARGGAVAPHVASSKAPAASEPADQAVLQQYCVTCHSARTAAGSLSLEGLDPTRVSDHADIWEKVVRKLRTGAMPPQGVRRPDAPTLERLRVALERDLDRAVAAHPDPGRSVLRRLNRTEYANAVQDALALPIGEVASMLPPDNSGFGFDNIGDLLGVSPALLERYLVAADRISALALGDPKAAPVARVYRVRQDRSQDRHIEGLPLGTVGGVLATPTLPVDGEYVIQARLFRNNLGTTRGLEYPHRVEISVDGERVHLASIGGDADLLASVGNPTSAGDAVDARLGVRVTLAAGPRSIAAAFLYRTSAQDSERLQSFVRSSFDTTESAGHPHIESLTVTGPFNPTGTAETPSRRRILTCKPSTAADGTAPASDAARSRRSSAEVDASEGACARQIVSTVARRLYRRPVTDVELTRLLQFYETGRAKGGFESGIQMALRRILASPAFVFRAEPNPSNVPAGASYRLSDLELATRLSFFLWSSIPDDELLDLASRQRLSTPAEYARQVRRMLADPRASRLVENFAGQWLQLRNLITIAPNSDDFPDFDDNLRDAFRRETEMLVESVMREDRSILDLLTADYTFVNERLARHYGIPNIYGSQFRRVPVADEARRGLLGQGSILAVTSYATRTSPVLRGKWILDNLLGMPPPPPLPNVPPLEDSAGNTPRTVRQQMEAHRANAVCASCHKLMDPLGLALENFDAVGAWRTRDGGGPIDATTQLFDGTQVDGVATLRQALLQRPDVFATTVTEKLMIYALGRGLQPSDMPVVRGIVTDAARHNYRLSAIIEGIAGSVPFRMRLKPAAVERTVARQGAR
jgi:hypothetical protein